MHGMHIAATVGSRVAHDCVSNSLKNVLELLLSQ